MNIYEIGTGYTPIPAQMGAATEIVIEELTRSLIKKGYNTKIIDIKAKSRRSCELPIVEVTVPDLFTGTDVKLGIMHKLKRVVYSISLVSVLRKILKQENERVCLHFHNQYNMFFFLKLMPNHLKRKCILVYTNHSYIWHGEWREIETIVKKKYFQEIECMKKANYVYALNMATKESLINHIGISERKIQLIDNGVNTDVYTPLSVKQRIQKKEELNLAGKKIFLQIGSVCDRKNQLGALKYLLPLIRDDKDMVFVYAGGVIDSAYQQNIIDFSESNNIINQVCYLGELKPGSELNKIYNIAEVMVFPSKAEGFSLVILEAMSAGLPVLVDKKLKFNLSDECLQFSTGDEFVKLIKEQIYDKNARSIISKNVRNSIIEKYSWDKIAIDYYDSWQKL